MNKELQELLERANAVEISEAEQEEQRLQSAAANGHLADSRITVATVRTARDFIRASQEQGK